MKKFNTYYIILACVIIWNILLTIPPFIKHAFPDTANFLYSSFNHICHQYDSKSIFLYNEKFAVCSRCWGIYFGFLIGTIGYPLFKIYFKKSNLFSLCIAAIPILIEITLDLLEIHKSVILTKTLTGIFFGTLSAPLLVKTLEDALREKINKNRRNKCLKNQTNSSQLYMAE